MHTRLSQGQGTLAATICLIVITAGIAPARGDDTGILGRLFRLGGNSSDSGSTSKPTTGSPNQFGALPYGRAPSSTSGAVPPTGISPLAPAPMISNYNGLPSTSVTTPPVVDGPSPRLAPKPRTSPAVTTADPLLTRFALGRSNDGSQFGMFLQIFADGTVVDSEGVHHIRAADLRAVVDTVQSGDLYRVRGHCGAPSTDFIEYVHVVIYERRLGRLNAHSFSYSGNTQGCDQSVRQLHTILENLQAKLSRQPGVNNPGQGPGSATLPTPVISSPLTTPVSPSPAPLSPAPTFLPRTGAQPSTPAVNPDAGAVIPLTPVDPSR
jgi:hypothetical protein